MYLIRENLPPSPLCTKIGPFPRCEVYVVLVSPGQYPLVIAVVRGSRCSETLGLKPADKYPHAGTPFVCAPTKHGSDRGLGLKKTAGENKSGRRG